MNILIDMNLAPEWIGTLQSEGHEARHRIDIGVPRAADRVIMEWARVNGFVVFSATSTSGCCSHRRGRRGRA